MGKKRGKDLGQLPKKLNRQPFQITRTWLHAAGAVAVAISVYFIYQGMDNKIQFLSPYNTEQLKSVFFGNESWVVVCHNETNQQLPVVFQNAHKDLTKEGIRFGVLDCNVRLPSGKTTFQRMNLKEELKPTIFITGPGAQPYQVRPDSMTTATGLINRVRAVLNPKTVPIASQKALKDRCLAKPICAMVLKENEPVDNYLKEAVHQLKKKYRSTVTFASLDHAKFKLELNPMLERGYGDDRFLVFQQNEGKDARPGMIEYADSYEVDKMSAFLDGIISNTTQIKPLKRFPLVKEWPKGERPAFKTRKETVAPATAAAGAPSSSGDAAPGGRSRDARKARAAQQQEEEEQAKQQQQQQQQEPKEGEFTPPPRYYTPEEVEQIKAERRQREAEKRAQLEEEMADFISAVGEDEQTEHAGIEEEEDDSDVEEISFD